MIANREHEVTYQEIAKLIKSKADKVSSAEVLAIAANMLGKILAFQDQRIMDKNKALTIIIKNLEMGNQQAIDELANNAGGST